ncbi:MAG: hypothetical protein JRD89_14970 [Deltaproteobacteria bacterium]|nr:hypothetical protein [Deltaproteobacteria bacterium]
MSRPIGKYQDAVEHALRARANAALAQFKAQHNKALFERLARHHDPLWRARMVILALAICGHPRLQWEDPGPDYDAWMYLSRFG